MTSRLPQDRQRRADLGLAALYAAVFLGYTAVQLRTKVLELPWVGRSFDDSLAIVPRVEILSRAALGFVVVCAIALAWRRSKPEAAFLAICAVGAVQVAIGEPISFWDVAMPIGLFSAAAYATRTFARLALAVATLAYIGVWAIEVDLLGRLDSLPNPVDVLATARGATFVVLFALLILIWAIGDQVRAARERLERDLERTEQRAREQEANARLGALAERQRIARELHDVVAHGLSVMVVQADGARYAQAEHPDAPGQALAAIAATGRESLAEMRRLLGALRDDPETTQIAPQPTLASVPSLIQRFREAGLVIDYHTDQQSRPVPPAVGLAAYRVIQEALTNVLHHAGATHVEVRIQVNKDTLEVGVVNDPGTAPPSPAPEGSGLGLVGMRERVSLLEGRMAAGLTSDGGFRVQVEIPMGAPLSDATPSQPEDSRQAMPPNESDVARGGA